MAEDILGIKGSVSKWNRGDQVDQFAELGLINLQLGVALVEHPLELGIIVLNGFQRMVDQLAN